LKVDVKEGVTIDVVVALSLLNDVVLILKDVSVQVKILVKNPVSTPLRLVTSLVNGVEISQLIATLLRVRLLYSIFPALLIIRLSARACHPPSPFSAPRPRG